MKSHADLIFSNPSDIADYDVDLWQAMQDESIRQEDHIAVSYTHLTLPTT